MLICHVITTFYTNFWQLQLENEQNINFKAKMAISPCCQTGGHIVNDIITGKPLSTGNYDLKMSKIN